MQELVLVQPGRTAGRLAAANDNDRFAAGYSNDRPTGARDKEEELAHEAAQADTRREFEERLAECGPLAYRVAHPIGAMVALQLQAGLDGFLAIEKHLLVKRCLFPSARRRGPYGWELDAETAA